METLLGILFALLSLFGLESLVSGSQEAGVEAIPAPSPGAVAEATPAQAFTSTFTMIEHADNVTILELGSPRDSIGDMIVWGPDPLFDEFDISDTGATTQGTCVAINIAGDCLVRETIVFPDGSTLELQGIQPGATETSTRTIVGGSGQYLGASGTVTVEPSADGLLWTKTFEIWM
jgi:hypothetical protein